MTNNRNNNLVQPDVHLAKQRRYDKLRDIILKLSALKYKKQPINRMIQNFIPMLKRTDKDCGSLPFYSQTYTSKKPNREHCLLCVISMLVQVYWDIAAGNRDEDIMSVFDIHLELLENIYEIGFDKYRVAGKFPQHVLMTKEDIIAEDNAAQVAAIEEAKQERAEDDMKQEEEQPPEPRELGMQDAKALNAQVGAEVAEEHDRIDAAKQQRKAQPVEDQLSVEDADACSGDCDTCEDQVCDCDSAEGVDGSDDGPDDDSDNDCDTEQPKETGDDKAVDREMSPELVEEINDAMDDLARRQAQADDGEPYPDKEDLEQVAKDQVAGEATPPMPEEDEEDNS